MDSLTHTLLQDVIRRESRSLLQYVREAFPWASPAEQSALAQLEGMIEEERQGAAALGKLLQRRRLPPPYLGAYPMDFPNINYVSLDFLVPLLLQHQRRAIGDLERDLTCLHDSEAREQVQKILDIKRRHLERLEKLLAKAPAA